MVSYLEMVVCEYRLGMVWKTKPMVAHRTVMGHRYNTMVGHRTVRSLRSMVGRQAMVGGGGVVARAKGEVRHLQRKICKYGIAEAYISLK